MGHSTFTVDNDEQFNPDLLADIMDITKYDLPYRNVDILWASPPCQCFSVSTIGKFWKKTRSTYEPKDARSIEALKLLHRTVELIKEINPKHFFIENPRGMMRKMEVLDLFNRHTVTYCQYGFSRMKPTDIWTLSNIELKPPCKNGDSCHTSAPRGSVTGTQGFGNAKDRGVVPPDLIKHILTQIT